MKKYIYFGILLFIISIIIGYLYGQKFFVKTANTNENENKNESEISENTYEEIVPTISKEIKVLPTTYLGLKKKYKGCQHIDFKFVELPKELINKNKEEVDAIYPDWKVEEFYENKVILYKEEDGICDEHFLIKLGDECVEVYRLLDMEENKMLYEKTGIDKQYLTEDDIKRLENGIYVYGKDNVNSIIEDFE